MFSFREEMKYTMEEGGTKAEKSSASISIDCCMNQEMKRNSFQRLLFLCPHYKEMTNSPWNCGLSFLFFFLFILPNEVLVCKGYLNNFRKWEVFFYQQKTCYKSWVTGTEALRQRPRNLSNMIKRKGPYYLWLLATVCLNILPYCVILQLIHRFISHPVFTKSS